MTQANDDRTERAKAETLPAPPDNDPSVMAVIVPPPRTPPAVTDRRYEFWSQLYARTRSLGPQAMMELASALDLLTKLNEYEQLAAIRVFGDNVERTLRAYRKYGPFDPRTDTRERERDTYDECVDGTMHYQLQVMKARVRRGEEP